MSNQDRWIRAICNAPDDDVPRLDYAKWLTQQGDPLGQFIRIQCEIADVQVESPRYWELDQQLQALLNDHEPAWLGNLCGRLSDWTFTRGFLTSVTVDGSRWLPTSDGRARYFAPLKPGDVVKLLELLPPTLTTLELPGNQLGPAGVQAIMDAQHLKLLSMLDVRGHQPYCKPTDWDNYVDNIGPAGTKFLAESPWATRLRELHLDLNRVDDQAAAAISTSPYLRDLRLLTLHESNDEPFRSGEPWFSQATTESLRTSFGRRLSLRSDCPTSLFGGQDRRKRFT